MSEIKEVVAGIWRWTAPHPEWRPEHEWGHQVASFALEKDAALVLIDPLVPSDDESVWSALDGLVRGKERVFVMITVPYHVRSSEAIHARFADRAPVQVWGHAAVGRRLRKGTPLERIEPGARLPGEAQAIAIGSPRRQEMPLYFPSQRALAFGDTVVGLDGTLRVWEVARSEKRRRWYRTRFVPSLEPLLDLDVDHVLVTHGPPVIGGGKEALARALAAEPWHYR